MPEASIFLMIAGVGYVLWGLGAHSQVRPAHPLLTRGPSPAAVMMPPPALLLSRSPVPSPASPRIALPQTPPAVLPSPQALASEAIRIEHARELLGKFYDRSVVKSGEKVVEVDRFVRSWTDRALTREYKKYSKTIADAVLAESVRNSFDPVFLMAVIENESSFDPHVIGPVGEIGLMQVTPATGEWIARKFGIKWEGKNSLKDPKINIRIGAAYLAYLREEFDSHSQLYLAAYNMGSLNVNRALEKSIWPKDYPQRVMKRYIKFYGDLKSVIKAENKTAGPPKT